MSLKNHLLLFNKTEERDPLPLTEQKADVIRQFLKDRNVTHLDLTDDDGKYVETIPKRAIYGVRAADVRLNSDMVWICDHGKQQDMKQGCYIDQFGNRAWSGAKCACVF